MFAYGQVESPYGSGQFIKDLREHFGKDERVVDERDPRQGRHRRLHQGVPRQRELVKLATGPGSPASSPSPLPLVPMNPNQYSRVLPSCEVIWKASPP